LNSIKNENYIDRGKIIDDLYGDPEAILYLYQYFDDMFEGYTPEDIADDMIKDLLLSMPGKELEEILNDCKMIVTWISKIIT
jgi:hypothetical protein